MRYLLLVVATFAFPQLYAQVPNYVPADGLVGWWPFTGNANDESGNGYNGTVTAAVLVDDRDGTPSSAYSFNGSSSRIFMGNIPELATAVSSGLTVSLWMNSSSFSTANTDLFDLRSSDNSSLFIYANYNDAGILGAGYFDATGSGGGANGGVFSSYPALNEWYHLVFVQEIGSDLGSLYINGALVASDAVYDPAMLNPKLSVGARYDAFNAICCHFNGVLDDMGFWNRALTAIEVAALYSGQPPPPCVSSTQVSFTGLDASYTTGDEPVLLTGAPEGGVFIGPGLTADSFDPEAAGLGTHSIMYVYLDENGCVNSAGLCTTVDQGVGLWDATNQIEGGLRLFPNPNRGHMNVEVDLTGLVALQVIDMGGRIILNEVFEATGARTLRVLNLSAASPGAYSLRILHNGSSVTQQFVIE